MRSIAAKSASVLSAALAVGLLEPTTVAARSLDPVVHRKPLPTVEVVESPPKRVRLIDVRGPLQLGAGWSSLYQAPVYTMSFEASASVVELTERTWLHLTFGESGVVSAFRERGEEHPAFLGVDLGLGISGRARRGPAFLLTATAGPRWGNGGPRGLRPHGFGVQTKAELLPFYLTVPEIVANRGWSRFRRYVLSGLELWANARYDRVLGQHGNTWSGGLGFDLGRSVILPALVAIDRRSAQR
ncbi:MAG: hypothetical protein AAGF11_16640 [Myxococcota bacterium]